jgi:6-phosphogluconolactonase
MIVNYYPTADKALRAMTDSLLTFAAQVDRPFSLALSGGGTAKQMFRLWCEEYSDKVDWQKFRFFWVDERCVAPDDEESNYGEANKLFFKPMNIPPENVFRIKGEDEPSKEAIRYSELVESKVKSASFDAIILGIGNDGHTASIFPNLLPLLKDQRNYVVSNHPVSGQYRISMSGTLILNGLHILVPVLGPDKEPIFSQITSTPFKENRLPSAYILENATEATVFRSR